LIRFIGFISCTSTWTETLPEVVAKVIAGAPDSGRKLSWKVQESELGTLVPQVWKSAGYASTAKTKLLF